MDQILRSKLIKEQDGYTVYVYLQMNETEFAEEFEGGSSDKRASWLSRVKRYINNKYPSVKVQAIKIVVGSMVISTIPFKTAHAQSGSFVMSYQFFGSSSAFINQVKETQGNLNTVVPYFFDIDTNGDLVLTSHVSQSYVDEMHKEGLKVVPYITNNWSRDLGRLALKNRSILATEIANAVQQYNLDGVNVDLENLTEVDKNNYTDFVKLLRENLPADKEVSVAVVANPNHWTTGWQGSYDYAGLAEYSNYLFLMAYDESWVGGPEGPVASLPWVEQSIKAVLDAGVPSSKVVLGLPFYGRYWEEGDSVGGYGISNLAVQEMLNKYGGTSYLDPISMSPEVTITITQIDQPFVYSGRTLGPGTYHIYYENDQSIQSKIQLAEKYNLKGTGGWALGEENPEMWTHYHQWIVGTSPENSPTSGGGTASSPAGLSEGTVGTVSAANSGGGGAGTSSSLSGGASSTAGGTLNPAAGTSTDATGTAGTSNSLSGGTSSGTTASPSNPAGTSTDATGGMTSATVDRTVQSLSLADFQDVNSSYWAYKEIMNVKKNGWMTGKGGNLFKPDAPLTRAEAAIVFVKALNLQPIKPVDSTFKDIPNDFWAKKEIEIAAQHGLFSGHADGSFDPEGNITREQMAVVLNNVKNGNKVLPKPTSMPFSDVSPDHWSAPAILAMYNQGILTGHSDGSFGPTELLSRAQMAVLISKIVG